MRLILLCCLCFGIFDQPCMAQEDATEPTAEAETPSMESTQTEPATPQESSQESSTPSESSSSNEQSQSTESTDSSPSQSTESSPSDNKEESQSSSGGQEESSNDKPAPPESEIVSSDMQQTVQENTVTAKAESGAVGGDGAPPAGVKIKDNTAPPQQVASFPTSPEDEKKAAPKPPAEDGEEAPPPEPKAHDKDHVHVDANKVFDDSKSASYKPVWNRAKFIKKADVDSYVEFMKEHRRETQLYQEHGEWLAAQEAIKKSYFMNIQTNKFEEFLIHGFIASMGMLLLFVVLCILMRKCCSVPGRRYMSNRDMEQLDREAYNELKKDYMERRRQKIAEQRQIQHDQEEDPGTPPDSKTELPMKKNSETELQEMTLQ